MHEILHFFGLCHDSIFHFDLLDILASLNLDVSFKDYYRLIINYIKK